MLFIAFLVLTLILLAMTLLESRFAFIRNYPLLPISIAFCLNRRGSRIMSTLRIKWSAPYIPPSTIKAMAIPTCYSVRFQPNLKSEIVRRRTEVEVSLALIASNFPQHRLCLRKATSKHQSVADRAHTAHRAAKTIAE